MAALNWLPVTFLIMDIFLIIGLVLLLASYIINAVSHKFRIASTGYLWLLFAVHFALTITYMIYAANSTSDSYAYYKKASETDNWGDLFDTGTMFISFLGW